MPTPPVRIVPRKGGGVALEVDGVTQSVMGEPQGYWPLMLPPEPPEHALLLGMGGGTIAHLLAARWPQIATITGVERDPRIIALAHGRMGLGALKQLSIIEADVFPWVAAQAREAPARYDYIAHDLYVGARMVPGALGTPFLRQVATQLRPGGYLAINLVRTRRLEDQVARLRRVYEIAARLETQGNTVLLLTQIIDQHER